MIIYNFHIIRIMVTPLETNAPPVIDSNAVLSFPIAVERLQPVGGRDAQIV